MKNALLIAFITILFVSCKKDKNPPVITLTGDANETTILNQTYIDQGATAIDEDGDLSAKIEKNGSVDINKTGSYPIIYRAIDDNGNVALATRIVTVINEAEAWAASYSVSEKCGPDNFTYNQTITASETVNNRIIFSFFGDYANNKGIYAEVRNDSIFIPLQHTPAIGQGTAPCAVADHSFEGKGTKTATGFTIDYTDTKTSSGCEGSTTCTAIFTRK